MLCASPLLWMAHALTDAGRTHGCMAYILHLPTLGGGVVSWWDEGSTFMRAPSWLQLSSARALLCCPVHNPGIHRVTSAAFEGKGFQGVVRRPNGSSVHACF